ncbi:MAG TPA: hypothetical protein VGR22_03110 [Thermomicrobiales bacterium]|nr:hypothetical protein [Thermomicrobiales bacterium]
MRLFRVMAPVLLAFSMVAGMTTATAAQDVPEATPETALPEGLEKWYARTFSADLFAMFGPEASPAADPEGWFLLSTNVLKFETEEQAAAAAEELLAQFEEELAAEDLQLEDVELDLELDYTAQRAEEEDQGLTTVVLEAVAQDGQYVYAVVGVTLGVDPAPLIERAIQAMQEGDVSGEEDFDIVGMSEGGLWAKLPTVEEITAEAPALVTVEDTIFFPAPELQATPAA